MVYNVEEIEKISIWYFGRKQNDEDTKEMYINKGGENMRRENGITLIALIINLALLNIILNIFVIPLSISK